MLASAVVMRVVNESTDVWLALVATTLLVDVSDVWSPVMEFPFATMLPSAVVTRLAMDVTLQRLVSTPGDTTDAAFTRREMLVVWVLARVRRLGTLTMLLTSDVADRVVMTLAISVCADLVFMAALRAAEE